MEYKYLSSVGRHFEGAISMNSLKNQILAFTNSLLGKFCINIITWISIVLMNFIPSLIILVASLSLDITLYHQYAEGIFSTHLIISITTSLFVGTIISTLISELFYKYLANHIKSNPFFQKVSIDFITELNTTLLTFLGIAIAFSLAISSSKVVSTVEINFFVTTTSLASLSATLKLHEKFHNKSGSL